MQNTKYSRVDVTRSLVSKIMEGVYTMLPAIVQSYNPDEQTATVQYAISQNLRGDSSATNSPIVNHVPVSFPYGNNFRMGWTLKKGDNVMLLFSMRGMEEYLSSDGSKPVVPFSKRRHSNIDAVAIAGIFPKPTREERFKEHPHLSDSDTHIVFNRSDEEGLYIETDKDFKAVIKGDAVLDVTGNVTVNCVKASVNATDKVTLNTPETHCTGNLKVDGKADVTGEVTGKGIELSTHKHAHGNPNTSKPL